MIFFVLHEATLLEEWSANLLLYKRFIDDVIGIWIPDPNPHCNTMLCTSFKNWMQQWHGVKWEFSELSHS